jgi:hypothetical protein
MHNPAGYYDNTMPMPKRKSVDDFFAQLNDVQRPHLEALRALSLDADPEAREELKMEPAGVRPRREDEPVDASEL